MAVPYHLEPWPVPSQRGLVAAVKHIPRRGSLNRHIPTNTETQNAKIEFPITNCTQEFRIWCQKTICNLFWTAEADDICMVEAYMIQNNNSSLIKPLSFSGIRSLRRASQNVRSFRVFYGTILGMRILTAISAIAAHIAILPLRWPCTFSNA